MVFEPFLRPMSVILGLHLPSLFLKLHAGLSVMATFSMQETPFLLVGLVILPFLLALRLRSWRLAVLLSSNPLEIVRILKPFTKVDEFLH